MNRENIYCLKEGEGSTFEADESLPPFPLQKLEDTLERYYESLKPFGNESELANSRRVIEEFKNGSGQILQKILEERYSKHKNWLEEWWDKYAYLSQRAPLWPYCGMAMPLILESVGIPETSENHLKTAARYIYFSLQFWELAYKQKLKPGGFGKQILSSKLYKQFFSTVRVPGEEIDRVDCYFETKNFPNYGFITGKGRIFKIPCTNEDGTILQPQQILILLQNIRTTIDAEGLGQCVPILTNDDRTSWAKNRKYIQEISLNNKNLLYLIESSVFVMAFDENEPGNYSDSSQVGLTGDLFSKWADKSSFTHFFKNGKISCIGEHSCYDGTISVSFAFFIQLSFLEEPEPDWTTFIKPLTLPIEMKFDLDDFIQKEIERNMKESDTKKYDVITSHNIFDDYGKEYIKKAKIHPDSFIQIVLQRTYHKLHGSLGAAYETALMRQYYNGRTETVRSCSPACANYISIVNDSKSTKHKILESFRNATKEHRQLMSDARKGNGIDRHLFGLWCAAYENNIEIPTFFSDPLFTKSGGGGNFILSTSTLGYTITTGFVAPMLLDGYGIFYSITSNAIAIEVTTFRKSTITSGYKFNKVFIETMREMKELIDSDVISKI